MKPESKCAIVRDLMPMYIENLTEPETSAFVEQHLADCAACRDVRSGMMRSVQPEERARAERLEQLRRARIRRKRRITLISAGVSVMLLAALAVCFLPLPRRVNTAVQAVRWRAGNEAEGASSVQVILDGYYMDYLFRTDCFRGDIAIEGVAETQRPGTMLEVLMDRPGMLIYKTAEGMLQPAGFIVASPGMEEFVIGVHEISEGGTDWSGENGVVLTFPAEDRADAVEATRRIAAEQDCTWLSESVWEGGAQPLKTKQPDSAT